MKVSVSWHSCLPKSPFASFVDLWKNIMYHNYNASYQTCWQVLVRHRKYLSSHTSFTTTRKIVVFTSGRLKFNSNFNFRSIADGLPLRLTWNFSKYALHFDLASFISVVYCFSTNNCSKPSFSRTCLPFFIRHRLDHLHPVLPRWSKMLFIKLCSPVKWS